MLLSFHGVRRSEAALARALRTTEARGTNRADLMRVARTEGLRVKAGGMTLAELRAATAGCGPVIVNYVEPHEDIGHFAVALAVSDRTVTMADPWHGEAFELPLGEFSRRWLGYKTRNATKGWGLAVR